MNILDIEKPRFNNTPSDAVRLQFKLDAELWVKRFVVPVSSTLHSSMTEHPSRLRVQNYELTFEVRSVNMKYSQASSWPKSSTGKLKVHIFFPPMILTKLPWHDRKNLFYSLLWRSFSRNSRIKYPINPHWLSAKTNPTKRSTCKWFVKIEMPTSSSRSLSIVGKIKFNPATRPGRHLT